MPVRRLSDPAFMPEMNLRLDWEDLVKHPKGGLSSTLESYLELIYVLQLQYGAVRVTDLAGKMGCKTPSATSALRRLAELHLINYQAYRPVTLTKEGKSAVRRLNHGHRILADFLLNLLALPEEFAEEEACRLEHQVSAQLLARLAKFLEFLHDDPGGSELLKDIQTGFANHLADEAQPGKGKTPAD